MRTNTPTILATASIAVFLAAAVHAAPIVKLKDGVTKLRVGQVAELRVKTSRQFSIGGPAVALVLVSRKQVKGETVYLYRAAKVGRDTIIATPKDPGPDNCVSCVTQHYFVEIVR